MPASHGRGGWVTPPISLMATAVDMLPPGVLSGAGYVVTWVSPPSPSGQSLFAQRYDALGNEVGGQTLIDQGGRILEPTAAILADGGYVVGYELQPLEFGFVSQTLYAQRVDPTGALEGDRIEVASSIQRIPVRNFVDLAHPSVTGLGDGGFVVAWSLESAPFSGGYFRTVGTERFDSQGVLIDEASYPAASDPVVVATSDGGYLLAYHVWEQTGNYALPSPYVTLSRFDSAGTVVLNGSFYAGGYSGWAFSADTVAMTELSDGGLVLTGLEAGTVFRYQLDASGAFVEVPREIGLSAGYAVVALSGGGYVVWETLSTGDPPQLEVVALAFDSAGLQLGEPLRIDAPEGAAVNGNPHLTALAGGGFAVTWIVTSATDSTAVYTQAFEEARLGSNAADHLLGTDASDVIYGMAGADHILGLGGNDKLDGGEGRDVMAGGPGDDRYVVDNVHDRLIEHAGEGQDTVYSAVSYQLGPNIERLVLTGAAQVDGAGNELDNVITGNAAANRLAGGQGNDVLDGAGGHDVLVLDEKPGPGNIDVLANFVTADDVIELDAHVFRGIANQGTLGADAFQVGPAALDADDRIIYDPGTGALMYDPDGTGEAAALQIATLLGVAGTLSAENFVVA